MRAFATRGSRERPRSALPLQAGPEGFLQEVTPPVVRPQARSLCASNPGERPRTRISTQRPTLRPLP